MKLRDSGMPDEAYWETLLDVDLILDRLGVEALPKDWAVGQRAEVYVETGRKESAAALPLRFVSWRRGKPGAFVMQGGKTRWREMKPGLRGLETIEVAAGFSAGDVVCKPREANQPLADGQRVASP